VARGKEKKQAEEDPYDAATAKTAAPVVTPAPAPAPTPPPFVEERPEF
jgi:hypothetical protein